MSELTESSKQFYKVSIIIPILQIRSYVTERLNNLPKNAQLLSSKVRIRIQTMWLQSLYSQPLHLYLSQILWASVCSALSTSVSYHVGHLDTSCQCALSQKSC